MGSDSILAGIGATVLAVTLLVCGFAACCLPVTTASLAGAVSTGADSPYTHEQLVSLAQETRAFTVDAHSSMEEARESLAADVVAAAREASAEGAPKYSQWTQKAKQVLGDVEGEGGAVAADDGAAAGDGSALETMDALAKVSDRYALDAAAVSHLEDCNGLITGLSSYLGMIGVAALIIALVLGFRKQFAALAFMLRMGPALLLAVLVVLGLWGVIDFNGLFAAFHSLFFVDGTWTFNYDSLLISMYPIDFWMGMGAVWVGSAIGVGLLCFAAGCLFAWKAQVQHRELEEAAYIDGCTHTQTFFRIVFPLLKPIISTMVIMNAMAFWNDFLLPSLVLTDKKLLTLPLSTYSFYGTYSADYGTIMAGLLLCVIPILILYVALQKQIINGVVAGAVK